MRLLAVTDLHYRLPLFDWLLSVGAGADLVALTGDLLDIVTPVPHETQAVVVGTYLRRLAELTPVAVCSGNHDLDGPGPHGEQQAGWLAGLDVPGLSVDGATLDTGDIRITVAPWWDGPASQATVGEQLRSAAEGRPKRWIWLYHAPPAGTRLCFDGRRTFPDESLTAWVDELAPDVVLCGHIHQAPWVDGGGWYDRLGDTVVINPGKQIGKVPPHVWIDTDAGRAIWSGLGETDAVDLW